MAATLSIWNAKELEFIRTKARWRDFEMPDKTPAENNRGLMNSNRRNLLLTLCAATVFTSIRPVRVLADGPQEASKTKAKPKRKNPGECKKAKADRGKAEIDILNAERNKTAAEKARENARRKVRLWEASIKEIKIRLRVSRFNLNKAAAIPDPKLIRYWSQEIARDEKSVDDLEKGIKEQRAEALKQDRAVRDAKRRKDKAETQKRVAEALIKRYC